jgi:hypothetical protein
MEANKHLRNELLEKNDIKTSLPKSFANRTENQDVDTAVRVAIGYRHPFGIEH